MTNVDVLGRLRTLRKEELKLSQEEFGAKIGLSKSNISNIEIGRVDLTDRNINMICKVFNVNEIWFRTGDGGNENMFTEISPEDRYSINLGKLAKSENEFVQNAVNYLAENDPEKLIPIVDFMKGFLGID